MKEAAREFHEILPANMLGKSDKVARYLPF